MGSPRPYRGGADACRAPHRFRCSAPDCVPDIEFPRTFRGTFLQSALRRQSACQLNRIYRLGRNGNRQCHKRQSTSVACRHRPRPLRHVAHARIAARPRRPPSFVADNDRNGPARSALRSDDCRIADRHCPYPDGASRPVGRRIPLRRQPHRSFSYAYGMDNRA